MRKNIITIFIVLIIFTQIIIIGTRSISIESKNSLNSVFLSQEPLINDINELLKNSTKAFTENRGQLKNNDVRFYAQGGGLWFTDDGVWFDLRKEIEKKEFKSREAIDPFPYLEQFKPNQYKRLIVNQLFVGSNKIVPMGKQRLDRFNNFFYDNASSNWRVKVPLYQEIFYKNIYNGIDLRYYFTTKDLKYEFIVYPGANINQIKIRYEGAERLKIDDFGNLIIKTKIGNIVDSGLSICQNYASIHHQIEGRFVIYNNMEYGFEILDNYREQEILVIDPLLGYSTYFGGNNNECGLDLAVDSNGNTFVTGYTESSDFPTTSGAWSTTYLGKYDAFVFMLNQNGSSLNYSTYWGSTNANEIGYGITTDPEGNIYITGDKFIQNVSSGIFMARFYKYGFSLWSSWIHHNLSTDVMSARGIVVDAIGYIYITGFTNTSYRLPPSEGAYDTTLNGKRDVFILYNSCTGNIMKYLTYLGGSEDDWGIDIKIDQTGNVYVTGYTKSADFPTTPGAYDKSFNGDYDSFVVKFNSNLSKLNYSTLIGGNNSDKSYAITIDSLGNAYLTGSTNSSNFPTTENAFDTTYNGGLSDVFVLKLNQTGSFLNFSTFVGGNSSDCGYDVCVESSGTVYVTGYTKSSNFPVAHNAFDTSFSMMEGFLLKVFPNGSSLISSTFIGGTEDDCGRGIGLDSKSNIYITGYTKSQDFPITSGVYNTSFNGVTDIFVVKISFPKIFNITSVSLIKNKNSTKIVYSRFCPYIIRVNITNTISKYDMNFIRLTLDPLGTNIQLLWNRITGKFSKDFDPNNFITIEPTSKASYFISSWTFDFNVIFNWTYPDEELHDIQVFATSATLYPLWFNSSKFYCVENDIVFNGSLKVKGENNLTIHQNDLVRGGIKLNWTGLTPIYEGTTNIYPPDDEINITLWDEVGNSWVDSPIEGQQFNIETITPNITNINDYTYTINISSIPPECDKTNQTFTIRIDGDNVSFSNPIPDDNVWHRLSEVRTGITITDTGGGLVDGETVMYCISNDNGTTWGDWEAVKNLGSKKQMGVEKFIAYENGNDNLIKWRANDSVGNGPTESDSYRVLVDTEDVIFSNPFPLETEESTFEKVNVGIQISDNTSGVNVSTIMYSTSKDSGRTWDYWKRISGYRNSQEINISLNLTFPNGTTNRIKWRAYDISGNGPAESEAYKINVNTSLQKLLPQVELISPRNGSILSTTSVELSWRLVNQNFVGVTYDVYFDTFPPTTSNITDFTETYLHIDNLVNGETYYWTVVPRMGEITGFCRSGVWSFTVNTSVPVPKVNLIRPENGSILRSQIPTFIWSVEYEGSDVITYDVYLDSNKDPSLTFPGLTEPYYSPESVLEENTTYYWKVVPWAGNIHGPASEVWSFTVKKDYIPHFELELFILPPVIELPIGDIRQVKAIVSNLGELEDSILLRIEVPPESGVSANVDEPSIISVIPHAIAEFNIMVTTSMDAPNEEIILTVVASSRRAPEFGLIVEERSELTVKILNKEKKDADNPWLSLSEFWIIFLIIIIILIVLIIVWVVLKQKKSSQETKEESTPEDAVTVKPGTVPEAEISVGKAPATITSLQLPETTSTAESQQQTQTIAKVPTLASSTTPGQVPETQQIPQTVESPQLPPAPTVDEATKTNDQEPKE